MVVRGSFFNLNDDRFGNQGAAQAQNLRDSGIPNDQILIANREDSYADDAKSRGFRVEHDFVKAAEVADSEFTSNGPLRDTVTEDLALCSPIPLDP